VESNDSIKLQAMDFFELKVSLIEKILLLDEVITGMERALEEMEIQIIAQLNRGKFHSNRR
jgi:ABC-type branched-subunit amino acid transport system ATPase component